MQPIAQLLFATAFVAGVVASSPAAALPTGSVRCVLTTYYSDSSHNNEVGEFSTCPGGVKQGRRTRYHTSEVVVVEKPKAVGVPQGPDGVPCEFRLEDIVCKNVPSPRP